MKLNNNPDTQIKSLQEAKNKKILVKNNKKTSQLLFVFVGSFCLFLLANQAIWAQIESIYNSTTDEVAGISGLMSAVTNNDIEGVAFFSKGGPLIINQKNLGGATALHIACRQSNTEAVKILLENGASVNIVDNEGWTPLMRASLAGNAKIVEMLIEKNAKADAFNSIGETALLHATNSRCLDCLNIIIEKANLLKTANLKTLKTQITDAFLLARNQEESSTKTVLESFLDYVNKADNLLTLPIAETKPTEHLSESSLEESKSEPVKKLTINKKNSKKFTLKTTAEHQEVSENTIKSELPTQKTKQSAPKPIKKVSPEVNSIIPIVKNSIKTLQEKQIQSISTQKPIQNIVEKPKKSFKLSKPIEDQKNKIPTFTQQSLPPVVAPINQEASAINSVPNSAVSSVDSANKQENLKSNGLVNENKSTDIVDTASAEITLKAKPVYNEKKPELIKKFLVKKATPSHATDSQKSAPLQHETSEAQPLLEKSSESVQEKTTEVVQNSQEKVPEKLPTTQQEVAPITISSDSIPPKSETKQDKPEIVQNKSSQTTKLADDNLSQTISNNNIIIQNQAQPQEKLKKFKFSPLQDAKNKPSPISKNDEIKNNTDALPKTSATNKPEKSLNSVKLKRKYKFKDITDSENKEPDVEIKKLPVPQEI